jgi:peptidoglycan-associated lipoprotein
MKSRWAADAAAIVVVVMVGVALAGCHKTQKPVLKPMPPPSTEVAPAQPPPPPTMPTQVVEQPAVRAEPIKEDAMTSRSLDDLNRDSPLKPVFFDYDSAEVDAQGQAVLDADAALLKKYSSWVVTIEGHCDERGTAEYNLALGERRAAAARGYLVSLGISADRVKMVSYGKEFPFDPGHDEAAYARNRRAHFVITAK